MLSQLQQFMNQLGPMSDFKMPPQMEFAMKGISDIQKLIEKQEQLLEQTKGQADPAFREQQHQRYADIKPFEEDDMDDWQKNGMPPPPSATAPPQPEGPAKTNTAQHKSEQDALRYTLGKLMLESDEKLGYIPENMQMAEQAMRKSAEFLGKNDPQTAIPHQEEAIKQLKQSMDDMSKQLQQMMQQMAVFAFGGQQLDPLGRPMEDSNHGQISPASPIKIPDAASRRKVQNILELLRQRSGELQRPDYELDYFRRLMKQF
jgi:hypothetical protein